MKKITLLILLSLFGIVAPAIAAIPDGKSTKTAEELAFCVWTRSGEKVTFSLAGHPVIVPVGDKLKLTTRTGITEYLATDVKNFTLEPLVYNLTVSAAGYATLYLDYAAEIPVGVEAYTANAVDGEYLIMQPVEEIIPANTGVIVKATPGTYTFKPSTENASKIADNLFAGSVGSESVEVSSGKAAYVLSMVDGEVGMYRAELTNNTFLNNAHKAYLLLCNDENASQSNGYRFDFGGVTGISDIQHQCNEEIEIYDINGRRILNMENLDKGIYIINGKQKLVK